MNTGDPPVIKTHHVRALTYPPVLGFGDIPEWLVECIQEASSEVLDIPHPRNFQYESVAHCALNKNTVLVVSRRTSDGKTLIPQLLGLLRPGVCV